MDRNLALEFVRVTEAAAIAAAQWIGRGDKCAADQAAVDAMRSRLNQIDFRGSIVIGEGTKDEAPELYIGEKVGRGTTPIMDIAVDPLEATASVAFGRMNAIAVIATGPKGSLLHAPDTYMDKLAVCKEAASAIDLDATPKTNLTNVARALGKDVREITVVVLDRDRHRDLIEKIRAAGARVRLITDGDIASAIATCIPESGIDLIMGIGGSTEGVLAAAAVKILGGAMLCRFAPRHNEDVRCIRNAGISNLRRVFCTEDLAKGHQLTFTATGVIDGPLLPGVRVRKDRIITHSVVMRMRSRTIRYITTHHHNVS